MNREEGGSNPSIGYTTNIHNNFVVVKPLFLDKSKNFFMYNLCLRLKIREIGNSQAFPHPPQDTGSI